MKHVSEFVKFDIPAWVQGKEFILKGIYDRKDKETGAVLGKNALLVIMKDDCKNYRLRDQEETFSLVGEKVYVSCDKIFASYGDYVTFEKLSANVAAKGMANNQGFLAVYFNAVEIKKK